MKAVITGNRDKDLCAHIVPLLEQRGYECLCLSRETGFDFSKDPYAVIKRILPLAKEADLFLNLYANYYFNASVLSQKVFQVWMDGENASDRRMINVGSTTDRVHKGKANLYHFEKRALRELSSSLSLLGVWDGGPKVTHISYGTLENRQQNNPDRKCLDMQRAASYVAWILDQPKDIHINEISIDPVQQKIRQL